MTKNRNGQCVGMDEFIETVVGELGREAHCALPILHRVQAEYNYLPENALRRISAVTTITPARLISVATFYSSFRFIPAGKHRIKVCVGTACHVKGAGNVYSAFKRFLKISDGEDTDQDQKFTVEEVACLGCCMLAPAVQIDDITYGHVEPATVGEILGDFLKHKQTRKGVTKTGPITDQPATLRLCTCSSCAASGAGEAYQACQQLVASLNLDAVVKNVSCTGVSFQAPILEIDLPGEGTYRYAGTRAKHVEKILLRHLKPSSQHHRIKQWLSSVLEKVVEGKAYEPVTRYCVDVRDEVICDFQECQQRIATHMGGTLDPLDLAEYRSKAGFEALTACLAEEAPDAVIESIIASGLRGRGGGGFPTGKKWALVREAEGEPKTLICNGDEGDPGAFMDRMLLESFPFRIIEGMTIAAHAVGASEGIFYIRHEYRLAIKRVEAALSLCRSASLIGENIMGSHFSFQLTVIQGAGAFVCGEETALIASIEGKRGTPSLRPPYPSTSGLWGRPTLINNVETFSLIPWILRHGATKFARLGTEKSKGTKTFALAGKVARGGLIEVEMGMTINDIVIKIGGGVPDGKTFKAVQIGGPSGGCLPASMGNLQVDYDALTSGGAIMGSGGLVVLDNHDCMVDMARYFLEFTVKESCGKCTFCRVGTRRMLDILTRICNGEGKEGDIEQLEELAEKIMAGSICGLGRTAPNPVLSTLRYFREEYDAHLQGRCPAGTCKALITYQINDSCIGCTLCAQACPAEAIEPLPLQRHVINDSACIRCDTCREVCQSNAIEVI